MGKIRVTYSGLLAFSVGITSVLTGLFFTLMITRKLSTTEFGMWGLITSLLAYLLISETLITYWNVRQISRGEKVGKTSLFSTSFFVVAAIPIYLGYTYYLSGQSDALFNVMLLGVILVPVYFFSSVIVNINLGYRPHTVSYGRLIFEVVKIPAAVGFVVFLDLGIEGAILALLLAYFARLIVQIYFARPKLKDKFSFPILRRMMRMSIIPIYSNLPSFLKNFDVVIYPILIGSVIGIAYFTASFTIANVVMHSVLISQALYPKLLSEGNYERITDNFALFLYFAIPLLAISVIFSKAGLYALNPQYEIASNIVIILAFRQFFMAVTKFLQPILLGVEKVDLDWRVKFSDLIKSKLFYIPTINIAQYGIYISIFFVILYSLHSNETPDLELVYVWSLIGLIVEIPIVLLMWIFVQRNVKISFPLKRILKYVGATLIFVIIFVFTSEHIINYKTSIFEFLPSVILQFIICASVYIVITYLIDVKTRELVKLALNELKNKN